VIKALIFDFDGTLSNRQKNAYGIFDHYLRPFFRDLDEVGYEAVLQDMMYYDCNGTIPVHIRLIPFLDRYGEYLPEDFEEKFVPYYYENMYRFAVFKKETADVLKKLRASYKLGLLSNGDSRSQHNKIIQVEAEQYFDEVIVSGDLGIHKPDRRIFDIMAKRLGVKNEECIMVGDVFSTDITGAFHADMTPVWMCTDFEKPALHYAGYRIDDLNQLFTILSQLKEMA